MNADWENGGFGIYVHWPFCQAKCPYCDFNSHVRRETDHKRWQAALLAELDHTARLVPQRTVNTIFFGGGTPSLMEPDTVAAVIDKIRSCWPTSNSLEITLEANPTSVEAGKFQAFKAAGVNRVSMGVQSLDDTHLKALGRLHSSAEALQAFDIARNIYDHVSFDLIYARQNQTLEDWKSELSQALSLGLNHLSMYQLTIEPQTRFGELHRKGSLRGLPSAPLSADMYDLTQEICDKAGLSAYEVSNHAVDGAECKHNMIYWRYGDYAGIGPGAHGRLTIDNERHATESIRMPEKWLAEIELHGTANQSKEIIAGNDQAAEYLMVSMRLSEGCSLSRYNALAEAPIPERTVRYLTDEGFVWVKDGRLGATQKGRIVLNSVLRELLA